MTFKMGASHIVENRVERVEGRMYCLSIQLQYTD